MGHRYSLSEEPEILVRWKNWDPTDLWWQPWSNFFPSYNDDVVGYCAKRGIPLDVVQLLGPKSADTGGRRAHR